MGLEEDIQQKKFRSEYQKGVINIIYTANWLISVHSAHLKKYGLTPEQFNILRILRGQFPRPATVNLLIERMLNKMSNASRLVDKLLVKKLVERKTCREDRRAVDVIITKKGLSLLALLDRQEKEWMKKISVLSETEAKILNKLLDKIRK